MTLDIGHILNDWPYEPEKISARLIQGDDEHQKIQVRLDLGVLQMEPEDWDHTIDTNLRGEFYCAKKFAEIAQPGARIINFAYIYYYTRFKKKNIQKHPSKSTIKEDEKILK